MSDRVKYVLDESRLPEAWYNIGECEFHDSSLEAVGGDTTNLVFRGNWNVALRAFRRTLELDPSFHLAFAHIPDILHAEQRAGCLPPAGQTACGTGGAAVEELPHALLDQRLDANARALHAAQRHGLPTELA